MTSTVGGPVGSCETWSAAVVHSSSALPTADKGPSCSFNSATAYHYTHYDTSNSTHGVSDRYVYLNVIFP